MTSGIRFPPFIVGVLSIASAVVYRYAFQEWLRLCSIAVLGLCIGWLVSRAEYADKLSKQLDKGES